MKTTAKKTSTVHKSSSKPKPGKTGSAKAIPKKPAKPAASVKTKAQVKPQKLAKPVAKPAIKTTTRTKEKPKLLVKTATKTANKSAIKPAAKSSKATTTPSKPVAKAKTSSSVQKKVVAVKPAPKAAVKAAAKNIVKSPPAKPVVKSPAKPQSPTPISKAKPSAPVKPASKPAAKTVVVPVGNQSKTGALSAPPPVVVAQPAKPKSSKAGFNSPSNIAPLNTSVSTAAKTSFTLSSPVLMPPPPLVVKKDAKLVNNWKTKTAPQLSDQEVIAMPDSEYMNDKQMAFFRLKLVELKRGILSNAGETTEHLREDTSVVPDPADRATIEEEHALELRTRDRERKLLKKIEQSIQRIDGNDYGYCDETGEAIGVARLIARPTATLSIEAQQRRELKQKMFGD